jgi:septal ring factor EnvC (AmiA/AmiB activator)
MDSQELKDQILLDTHKEVAIIKASIAEIRTDLKEHIRRTGAVESRIEQVEGQTNNELKNLNRQVSMVHGALALVSLIAILAGIYKAFI